MMTASNLLVGQAVERPKQSELSRHRYCAEDVARMFEMRNSGCSWAKIGAEFGVCGKSVYEVCNRALVNGFDSYPLRGTKK